MTEKAQSTALINPVKSFFDRPQVKAKIAELVNKNAASFTTSVLQIVNSNEMLSKADPMSIFNAACMAATLNLPINNNLGFAYIVPYTNKSDKKTEAQFQIGYKGFIQLAQRSGQFERLVSLPVYENQLIKKDPINGFVFDWDNEPSDKEEPIGYYAYFKLINGFSAEMYMSRKEVLEHASKYSQSYQYAENAKPNEQWRKNNSQWHKNTDAMALKTVTKLLLSKQAPLSIEMQKAVMSDQSVIKDITNDDYNYIDNEPEQPQITLIQVDDNLFNQIKDNVSTGEMELSYALENYLLNDEQVKILRGE